MTVKAFADEIGVIILAAGSSRRFGGDKRRSIMANGRSLLENTLASIPPSLSRRILVLKPGEAELAELFTDHWQICFANDPSAGMANSLASGIALAANWQGVLIGLGDMPYIRPATYTALQQATASHDIVIPVFGGKRGNPVGFRQQYFDEMKSLQGDQGAKLLLQKYATTCFTLETQDEGILQDIDLPDSGASD